MGITSLQVAVLGIKGEWSKGSAEKLFPEYSQTLNRTRFPTQKSPGFMLHNPPNSENVLMVMPRGAYPGFLVDFIAANINS